MLNLNAWKDAKALDAEAKAIVLAAVPDALANVPSSRLGTIAERKALQLAATEHNLPAVDLYRRADVVYWRLVERNQGLVRKLAAHHAKLSRADVETVISVAQEGAFRGAIAWDPERGALSTAIAWQVKSFWQKSADRQGAVMMGPGSANRAAGGFGRVDMMSVDAPLSASDDAGTMLDLLAAPDNDIDTGVDARRVREAMAALDDREREVLTGKFDHDETNEDIGKRLGISREYVRQIANRAIDKVRKHMEDEMAGKRTGRPRDLISTETLDRIHHMRAEGHGLKAIAEDVGMVKSTVGRLLKREAEETAASEPPPASPTEPPPAPRPQPVAVPKPPTLTIAPPPPAREAPPQAPRSVHDIAAAIASATARMSAGEAKVREGERLITEARAALVTLHAELGAALAAPG